MHCYNIYKNPEAVAKAATNYLSQQIELCIADKDVCHVALPGGGTPARCLELLSAKTLAWEKIHWYLGDERCYPIGHSERNDSMINDKLWSRVTIPQQNQHIIHAELGAEDAAQQYTKLLHSVGALDIVLLGMGEDGHTASLFPGNPALDDERTVVPVFNAPKPPAERVTLGLSTLKQAGQRIALVTGIGKRDAMHQIKAGAALPINQIGMIHWYLDQAADAT